MSIKYVLTFLNRLSKPTKPTKLEHDGSSAHCQRYVLQDEQRPTYCLLMTVQRKLQEPVVACELGKLYNKDSIIEYLLDKSAYGDGDIICGHIRSLKVRLNIE